MSVISYWSEYKSSAQCVDTLRTSLDNNAKDYRRIKAYNYQGRCIKTTKRKNQTKKTTKPICASTSGFA